MNNDLHNRLKSYRQAHKTRLIVGWIVFVILLFTVNPVSFVIDVALCIWLNYPQYKIYAEYLKEKSC